MEDYKQKYEQAIERCKKEFNFNNLAYSHEEIRQRLEKVFPELNESERIKKFIIHELACIRAGEYAQDGDEKSDRYKELSCAIAWLEKQGEYKCDCKYVGCHVNDVKRWCHKKQAEILYEKCNIECSEYLKQDEQKPTDYELTPKALFKKGDWITNGIDFTFQVISIKDNHYLRSDDYFIDIETADKTFRLWTIQDAKDGDVLCDYSEEYNNPLIFILKKFEHVNFGLVKPSDYSSYCFLTAGDGQKFKEGSYHHKCNIKPATKEQRDQLEKAMKEAGYEWDAKKKELKKIETNPTWCEEDEEMIKGLNNCLSELEEKCGWRYTYVNNKDVELDKIRNWLKFLKERVQPKQKCDLGDEDEARYYGVLETEQYMLDVVNGIKKLDVGNEQIREECTKELTWLKSLKERYTWKPSEEQIIELHRAISGCSYDIEPLIEIEEHLKKLKEE